MSALPSLRTITGYRGGFRIDRLHRVGARPLRVLLLGDRSVLGDSSDPSHGWVPELLADLATRSRASGLDLDVLTDLSSATAAVRGTFQQWRLWRYDAVVLVIDTASVGSRTSRDLAALLEQIVGDTSVSAGIVVSPVRRTGSGEARHRASRGTQRWERPDTLDPGVVWQPMRVLPLRGDETTFHDARSIAEDLAASLDALVPAGRQAEPPADNEVDRQHALAEIRAATRPQDAKLDHIVRLAQHAFEVESAELNFLDADRTWHLAVAGADRGSHPRESSLCNITIQQPGATLIGNARVDPRVHDLLRQMTGPVGFYAAYPIESLDGYRIGTLCVYDPAPRDVEEVDVSLLRDFALLAEAEIIDPS